MSPIPRDVAARLESSDIDWLRVAAPEDDLYDARVILDFARARGYVRPVHEGPWFVDRKVALVDMRPFTEHCEPVSPDESNLAKTRAVLDRWAGGRDQFLEVTDSVAAFMDVRCSRSGFGSISGPGPTGFGSVASTANSPSGMAEALLHEMGHHRLHALGIHLESTEHLLINPPDEVFESPIRYDKLRPMGAVLHAQYSYTWVVALEVAALQNVVDDRHDREWADVGLALYLPKLVFGRAVLEKAKVDRNGARFMEGLFRWLDKLVEGGRAVLRDLKIAERPFTHPLRTASGMLVTETAKEEPAEEARAPFTIDDETNAEWMICRPSRTEAVDEIDGVDGPILYHRTKNTALSLNATAEAIWRCCDGLHTIQETTEAVASAFEVPTTEVHDAVRNTLIDLHSRGFVDITVGRAPRRQSAPESASRVSELEVGSRLIRIVCDDARVQSVIDRVFVLSSGPSNRVADADVDIARTAEYLRIVSTHVDATRCLNADDAARRAVGAILREYVRLANDVLWLRGVVLTKGDHAIFCTASSEDEHTPLLEEASRNGWHIFAEDVVGIDPDGLDLVSPVRASRRDLPVMEGRTLPETLSRGGRLATRNRRIRMITKDVVEVNGMSPQPMTTSLAVVKALEVAVNIAAFREDGVRLVAAAFSRFEHLKTSKESARQLLAEVLRTPGERAAANGAR